MTEKEALKITEEYLDTIDIKMLLEKHRGEKVATIMFLIGNMVNEDWYIVGRPDVFEGCVFNRMTEKEFVDYIERRYDDTSIFENTSYYVVR